jgi:MarR family transcriptional regulator for hemolysin
MRTDDILRNFTGELVVSGRRWRRLASDVIRRHGVPEAAASPLLWIGRLEEGVRQNVLADRCGIEGASLVRLVDVLSESGLVTRTPDPTDRRANLLHLTDTGRSIAEAVEADLTALRGRVMSELALDDIEAALRVFATIKAAAEGVDLLGLEPTE